MAPKVTFWGYQMNANIAGCLVQVITFNSLIEADPLGDFTFLLKSRKNILLNVCSREGNHIKKVKFVFLIYLQTPKKGYSKKLRVT